MSTAGTVDPSPDELPALVFEWRRAGSHWRLAVMIFLSLLAHAASFYVLQVAYTPTGSLLPPPARVILVPLDRPENTALARWLALSDPTLATQPPLPSTQAVIDSLRFHYQPSYDVDPPAFKPLDITAPTGAILAPPRPIPPGPVAMPEMVVPKASAPFTERATASRVVFSDSLRALAPVPLPAPRLKANAGSPPVDSTVYLVGARADGGSPFLFPVRRATAANPSTDEDEADESARDYLSALAFRPFPDNANRGVVWGRAIFYWGNDARTGGK